MNKLKISDFFNNQYVDFASYDNIRKIASLVDGQKNASRKVLYTVLEKRIVEKIKVSQLGSKVAEFAEYLHGSLDGVIVGLAQDFHGTNNIPLLQRKGNFGTRFSPAASASRYIFTHGTPEFFRLFSKDDIPILKHQFFEGQQIEPMFYVPSLPILLVNGSEGVSSGFAQKILPRNPDDVKKYIIAKLSGKQTSQKLEPFYAGFCGSITQGEDKSQWLIKGLARVVGINKIEITEIPIGYDLKSYIDILDDLEERKIILGYRDKSEDDKFHFEVTVLSKDLKSWTEDELFNKLKLIKKVSENYTVIDENNKIVVYENVEQIIDQYMRVKLHYMSERKKYLLTLLNDEIKFSNSKYIFIKMIIDGTLIVSKRKKADIIKDIESISDIHKKDGSYDYLFRMPIINMSEEELSKLKAQVDNSTKELELLNKTPPTQLWINDLDQLNIKK